MMIACYRCKSERCIKHGFTQGQQRYQCKECGYHFINKPRRGHTQHTILLAVWLYLSGLSQRRIARLLGVSSVTILKWIRKFALNNAPKLVPSENSVAVVELDEMWHFLKKNPTKSGYGKLFVLIQDSSLTGSSAVVIGPH